jgi:hypothetical protein
MAYPAVADDIDERGLARPQCTFKGGAKLLWILSAFLINSVRLGLFLARRHPR